MAITESLGALGNWTIQLHPDTPRGIRDALRYFGHLTVHTGRVEPALIGDALLSSSRFTGVLRGKGEADEGFVLTGCGMEVWLGDEDGKGVVIEEPLVFTDETPTQTIRDMIALTTAVQEGTFHAVAGLYSGQHQFEVLRKAIAYVCSTVDIEYRVNGDATLDVGTDQDLYVTDPKCLILKRGAGVDMDLRALLGVSKVDVDVNDYTTRALLLAASTESQVATGSAELDPEEILYKDRFGNPIAMTRIISESTTDATNADARAQLQLNRFSQTRDALALSTSEYDINGTARVGDYIWVYNPDQLLVDHDQEITFRGMLLNPIKLRLIETTWPVAPGFMVAYRDPDGVWFDLTDYVIWETGQTTLKVGGYNRSLTGGSLEPIGRLPQPDTSVPGQVEWLEPFLFGVYQSPVTGEARGEVVLSWTEPLNTNGTAITDGSHYEIRYRQATTPLHPVTFDQVEDLGLTCDQLESSGATWNEPIQYPPTEWQAAIAGFDFTTFRLQELVPSMGYEAQIRAVDLANPTNYGDWSELIEFQTTKDNVPPVTPAPPIIVSNPLAVQMEHRLGASTGGEYNLDRDLHHLELHGGPEPLFTPSSDTMLGTVLADFGMILAQTAIVRTFQINVIDPVWFRVVAVDAAGNRSLPSVAVEAIAGLIDQQYVSSLTVSKVTAGEISADWIIGGYIRTAKQGPRVEMNWQGLQGYDINGIKALDWKSSDGSLNVLGRGGITITDGALIVYNAAGQKLIELGECADGRHGLQVYKDNGTRVVRIGELQSGAEGMEAINDLGELVRIDTLAFGLESQKLSGLVSTTLSAFNGSTPQVVVTIGNSGTALVHLGAWLLTKNGGQTGGAAVSFGISGATTVAPAILDAMATEPQTNMGIGRSFAVAGLNPGVHTFYMSYRSNTNGQLSEFVNRTIAVQPY
jgi:hypothetical protein